LQTELKYFPFVKGATFMKVSRFISNISPIGPLAKAQYWETFIALN